MTNQEAVKAIFKDLGIQLENIQLRDLGRAKKVRVDAENTTITEGAGGKKAIKGRVEQKLLGQFCRPFSH